MEDRGAWNNINVHVKSTKQITTMAGLRVALMLGILLVNPIRCAAGVHMLRSPIHPKPWICQHLCSCQLEEGSGLYHGNCSFRQLEHLPKNLSANFAHLNFSHNLIRTIPALAFHLLGSLRTLDLSWNELESLNESAFRGLHGLEELRLNTNKLLFRLNMPPFLPGIFVDLQALHSLYIKNNSDTCVEPSCGYPDLAFSHLDNLRTLFIDGLPNKTFGAGFRNLTHLETLDMGTEKGPCSTHFLPSDMFINLGPTNLSDLTMQHCDIEVIHPDSFKPLKHINTLHLEWNRLSFENLKTGLIGLSDSAIKVLRLVHIHHHNEETHLPGKTFEALKNSNLTDLVLKDNWIVSIEENLISYLPKSLENFDLSENILKGKQEWAIRGIQLVNLRSFDASNQGYEFHRKPIPTSYFPPKDFHPFDFYPNKSKSLLTQVSRTHTHQTIQHFNFSLPRNLQYIYLQNSNLELQTIAVVNIRANSLLHFDISGNKAQLHGQLKGLHKMKYINLWNCHSNCISRDFFEDMPSLEQVFLGKNNLSCLYTDVYGQTFSGPENLRHLDLSDSNIDSLPQLIFSQQNQLESLVLHSNHLTDWQVKVGHMTQLKSLDLRHNSLTTLDPSARADLEAVLKHSTLRVNLFSNPLECSCRNIDFVKWISKHEGLFTSLKSYTCTLPDKTNTTLSNLPELVNKIELQCALGKILIGSSVSIASLLVIIILIGFIYRNRWKVRFLKNRLAFRLKLYEPLIDEEEDNVSYDAFLSYEDSQHQFIVGTVHPKLESQRGFRLCIHTRDFMPGTAIAMNIYRAIHFSKRTVAFITEDYFTSDWCVYELEMAYLESVHTGRQLLLPILMEQFDFTKLPKDQRKIFESLTYLDYTQMEEEQFFHKLADALQRSESDIGI